MIKKNEFFWHSCFLIATFIVGNTLIYFPKHTDIKSGILGIIIAAAISIIIYIAFSFLSGKANTKIITHKKTTPLCFALLTVVCFLVSLIASSDYISYVTVYRMPYTERIIISLIFIALSYYLALQEKSVILKIALIGFIYVFLSVTVLFVLSFTQLDFKAVLPLEFNGFETAKATLTSLSQSFLSALPLIYFVKTERLRSSVKIWILALILGLFVLLICMLNILCIFGPDLASSLELPYMNAMSVINMGKTFSRLEGFSYLNYFICSIIKTAAPLYVIRKICDKFFDNKGKWLLIPFASVLVILSLIYGITDFLYSIFFSVLLLVFEALTVLLLGLFTQPKNNHNTID